MKIPYSCGAMIKYIHTILDKKANNDLRSSDLTFSQITTLVLVAETPGKQLSLKKIQEALHIAQPTVTGIVARLKQKNMIEIKEDKADGRIKLVSITAKGEKQSKLAFASMKRTEAWLRAPLTDEEEKTFLVLLKKVCDGISKDE
ncbi:MAG: MarR family transcriptional regulator [Acidaminococcaceae bacterium]|jgi:DNA-binding MarR family transcriptional regulator|nr:MarR family transcriptional regulator [Acidaminococcaceae bacterium]MCI2109818.1 MarR family transcriptional regulator [Acidaminococcaceae bacterium]